MSTNQTRPTVRRRLIPAGVLAAASALTMLMASPASAAGEPTTPTNLHAVFVNDALNSIAWDASTAPPGTLVSYVVYNNTTTGRETLTQTSKTTKTVRDLVFVDELRLGATYHLSIQALGFDGNQVTESGFSTQLDVTLPKVVPPRG